MCMPYIQLSIKFYDQWIIFLKMIKEKFVITFIPNCSLIDVSVLCLDLKIQTLSRI